MPLEWEYSRNQLRHWVRDGNGLYEVAGHYYELFEIRTDRPYRQIRKPTDRFRLLHKGRQVDSHRIVKVLKNTAQQISDKETRK